MRGDLRAGRMDGIETVADLIGGLVGWLGLPRWSVGIEVEKKVGVHGFKP